MRHSGGTLLLTLAALFASRAAALDICPIYQPIHQTVAQMITSGIPFKLLSVAVDETSTVTEKVVRIEYDLWDEMVAVQVLAGSSTRVPLASASKTICEAASFPQLPRRKYSYKLLLNPGVSGRLKDLRSSGASDASRLLKVDWDAVLREVETERLLIEHEFSQ